MQHVVDFGRSFVTQSALRFDTADPAEQGWPGNVCRAQILASCEVTRADTANTFYLCQPCIGEHMYKENLPAGVEFQFQQPTVRRAGLSIFPMVHRLNRRGGIARARRGGA
jgi:hypothetical protein